MGVYASGHGLTRAATRRFGELPQASSPPMSIENETAAEPQHAPPSENPSFIASVIGAAGDHDGPLLRRILANLAPPDLADVIEHVPLETALTIARLIGRDLPPEMLPELTWERREEILSELPSDYVGRALGELDTDDAA